MLSRSVPLTPLFLAALVFAAARCGGPGDIADGGEASGGGAVGGGAGDLDGGEDGGSSADAGLEGGDGGGSSSDAGLDGGWTVTDGSFDGGSNGDAGSDGGSFDSGTTFSDGGLCLSFPGSSVPMRVSGLTRQELDSALVATMGSTTMVIWSASTAGRSYLTAHWAALDSSGTATAFGRLAGDTASAQLFVLAGQFHFFAGGVLSRYQNGAWIAVSGFSPTSIYLSGGKVLGVTTPRVNGAVYDGVTVSTSTQVSPYTLGAVADDGVGGFAVFSIDGSTSGTAVIHLRTFNGNSWSSDATVATVSTTSSSLTNMVAAYGASTLGFAYSLGNTTVVWVLQAGTWTSSSFAAAASSLLMRGGPNTLSVAAEGYPASAIIYSGGSWTRTAFTGATGIPYRFAASGDRYAFAFGTFRQSSWVALFDGTAWATRLLTSTSGGASTLAFNGTTLAVGYSVAQGSPTVDYTYTPWVLLHDGANWGTGVQLTSLASTWPRVSPALAFKGIDLLAAYSDPGVMQLRTLSGGVWSSATPLPMKPISGAVRNGASVARTNDGRALAAWSQYDAGLLRLFAAEYDGVTWGTAVDLGPVSEQPTVASNGTVFVIGWMLPDRGRRVMRWTGSGTATAVSLGQFNTSSNYAVNVASDGAGFLAVWDNGTNLLTLAIFVSSSADGITWSTPTQLGFPVSSFVRSVAGGPGGVVVVGSNNSLGTARVFKAGSWSTPSRQSTGGACRTAVGKNDAMFVCSGSGLDGQVYANGTWTDAVLTSVGMTNSFSLASDGVDYRIEYPSSPTPSVTAVYTNGAWTTPVTNPLVSPFPTSPQSNFVAGACGRWTLIYVEGGFSNFGAHVVSHANGVAPFPAGTTLPNNAREPKWSAMASWPGEVDALWTTPPPGDAAPALFIALGL